MCLHSAARAQAHRGASQLLLLLLMLCQLLCQPVLGCSCLRRAGLLRMIVGMALGCVLCLVITHSGHGTPMQVSPPEILLTITGSSPLLPRHRSLCMSWWQAGDMVLQFWWPCLRASAACGMTSDTLL